MDVAITGIGVISPIGKNTKAFWAGLQQGREGLQPMTQYNSEDLLTDFAGEVKNFRPDELLTTEEINETERCTQLAYFAAHEAVNQAQLDGVYTDEYRKGIALGTSLGGFLSGKRFHKEWLSEGYDQADERHLLSYPLHTSADFLSIKFRL